MFVQNKDYYIFDEKPLSFLPEGFQQILLQLEQYDFHTELKNQSRQKNSEMNNKTA